MVLEVFTLLLDAFCYCCCSVTKSCLTLCDPMDCNRPGSLSLTIFCSLMSLPYTLYLCWFYCKNLIVQIIFMTITLCWVLWVHWNWSGLWVLWCMWLTTDHQGCKGYCVYLKSDQECSGKLSRVQHHTYRSNQDMKKSWIFGKSKFVLAIS